MTERRKKRKERRENARRGQTLHSGRESVCGAAWTRVQEGVVCTKTIRVGRGKERQRKNASDVVRINGGKTKRIAAAAESPWRSVVQKKQKQARKATTKGDSA